MVLNATHRPVFVWSLVTSYSGIVWLSPRFLVHSSWPGRYKCCKCDLWSYAWLEFLGSVTLTLLCQATGVFCERVFAQIWFVDTAPLKWRSFASCLCAWRRTWKHWQGLLLWHWVNHHSRCGLFPKECRPRCQGIWSFLRDSCMVLSPWLNLSVPWWSHTES